MAGGWIFQIRNPMAGEVDGVVLREALQNVCSGGRIQVSLFVSYDSSQSASNVPRLSGAHRRIGVAGVSSDLGSVGVFGVVGIVTISRRESGLLSNSSFE